MNFSDLQRLKYLMFDMVLSKRGRGWDWRVTNSLGNTILQGHESKRPAARYQAERALFLLLMTTRTPQLDREDKV
jgi:hypothetical protein